jgi:hypothetical protein
MITGTKIGEVAVDSGQIMIIDPCYIDDDFNNQFDGQYEDKQRSSYEMNYNGCCQASLNEKGYGTLANSLGINLAIASRTAYGDGVYPVYAEISSGGRIKTLTIDFDPEPDEDNICIDCGNVIDSIDDCDCEY